MGIKEWLDLFLTISIIGIAILNYDLVKRKRKDELFDKRFKIYKTARLIHFMAHAHKRDSKGVSPEYEILSTSSSHDDFICEVSFLFDKKTANQICEYKLLCHWVLSGNEGWIQEGFQRKWENIPWARYLKLSPESYWQKFLAWRNNGSERTLRYAPTFIKRKAPK